MSFESSPFWYRVAPLKAGLHGHTRIHRHHYRGRSWYVLEDRVQGKHYWFGPGAYAVLRLLDGHRSVQQVWDQVLQECGDEAPDQEEMIRLLSSLHGNDLLQCDVAPDTTELLGRQHKARRAKWKARVSSPLLIRVPLFDPDRILDRVQWLSSLLLGGFGLLLWLCVVVGASMLAWLHWGELQAYWGSRALAPHNLLALLLIYPLVKGLHELAHGMAVKRWGGEVHETGIMFLVFMPMPYVDAGGAAAFRDKRKRMLVGAAGILTELFLAALALMVWLHVETGLVRDLAFNVMVIGGISTLLFNGNPLLRFDGYFVLMDAIEIPNLAQRSTRYYGYLARRYLFAIADARSPVVARGERPWFLFYGLLSTFYRMLVIVAVALFVAQEYLVAGVVIAIFALSTQLLLPLARRAWFIAASAQLRGRRARAVFVSSALTAILSAALFVLPAPSSTHAQGVVWLPEQAHVRAGTDGFVAAVPAAPGSRVGTGITLFELEDPLLQAHIDSLQWELRAFEMEHAAAIGRDRVEANRLAERMQRGRADIAQAQQRLQQLSVLSTTHGTFIAPRARKLRGRFVRQGDVLGYVTDLSAPTIRVVVGQEDVDRVRNASKTITIRLAHRPGEIFSGGIAREFPSATRRLPSVALGSAGGGGVAVDPAAEDGGTALEQVFLFDVVLAADVPGTEAGMRAYLRFDHEEEPLGAQWYRSLRQLLQRRLTI